MKKFKLNFKSIVQRKARWLLTLFAILTLGVGQMWGAPGARYYLIGNPKGDWTKSEDYKIKTWYEKDGKYVFYIYANKDAYFRLKKDDNSDYQPSSNGSTSQGYGNYGSSNAWKYDGSTGIVMFGVDETSGDNGEHYPYVFWGKPIVQIKHKWNNTDASWTAQNMVDKGNGKYQYTGKYSGSNATNCGVGSDGSSMKYFEDATLVGSPSAGDECRFEFNSSGYKGFGTQTQNKGSLIITKLYVVSFNMNGHGSAIDNQYIYPGETASTPSAPSATGYTFGGWYTDEGCTSSYNFSTAVNANRTLYAKWTAKTYDVILNVNGATSGSNQTVVATYAANMPTTQKTSGAAITAPSKTGYNFAGYYKNNNGTGTQYYTNALASAHVWDIATNNTNIYAHWTAKNYTVSFDNLGGSSTPASQIVTYNAHPSNMATFPTKSSYGFDGYWTRDGSSDGDYGVQVINENGVWNSNVTNYTDASGNWIKDDNSVTLYAHWLPVGYYITGEFDSWKLKEDHFFSGSPLTATVNITGRSIYKDHDPSYTLEFKIREVAAGTSSGPSRTYYGKGGSSDSYTIIGKANTTASGLSSTSSGDKNIKLQVYYDGDYKFELSTSPSMDVTVAVPVVDQLQIYEPDDALNKGNYNWTGPVSNIVTKTVTLARSTTYQFKAVYDSEYYGKGSGEGGYTTISRAAADSVTLGTGDSNANNVKLTTDVKGSYQFDFHVKTHKVKVTFPTKRLVTYSIVTKNGGSGASGSLTVTNDDDGDVNISTLSNYVADGNHVTFAAPAAKTGYTWRGWFSKNDPSNWEDGLLSSNATYSAVTISADKTVYAIYSQNDYTVAVEAGAGGSVASESVTAHYDNKVTLPTATPDEGYYFTGWEKTEGTANLYSTSSASAAQIDGVTSSNTVTVRANFHADDKIYFDNTYTKWSKVYVYLFNDNTYWTNSKENGVHPKDHLPAGFTVAEMTKVRGEANLYEYAYHTSSHNYSFSRVAFSEADQHTYDVFSEQHAVYRGDWHTNLPVYVATAGYESVQIDKDNPSGSHCYYHSGGYWRVHNPKSGDDTYYYLDVFSGTATFNDGQYFKASGDGSLVAEVTARFTTASSDYTIGVHSDAGGTNNQHYAQGTKITVNNSDSYFKLYKYESGWNITLTTTSEGEYTFVLSMEYDSLRLSVIYPASVNDYRLKYTENGKSHYSDIIKKKTAAAGEPITTSLYINKGGTSPSLKLEECTAIVAGVPTWTERKDFGFTGFGGQGVYQMDLTISGTNGTSSTLSNIAAYTGPYYIKTNGASGGWANYKQNSMEENTLNYDAKDPEKSFNYYYCKYYNSAGQNLKCVIANDYCNALTDTLIGDAVIGVGNQTTPSAASVRFSYNSYTNEIKRSYLGSSVNDDFLRILGNTTASEPHIYAKDEASPGDATAKEYIKFEDKQNWRYEIDVKADVNAHAKLTVTFNSQTQYFMGAAGESGHEWDNENTEQLFGGDDGTYGLTLVYDFKTNKLIRAWRPTGATISSDLSLESDVLLLREHQGAPTAITFGTKPASSDYASLTDVKTVYGVLRFNRWKLSNRARPEDVNSEHCDGGTADYDEYHAQLNPGDAGYLSQHERELYFISFPFDVKMNDIIHFGGYYDKWGIMYYDGKGRAKNGYWIDSESNWKYFTPEEFATKTLNAYEGYLIGIDLTTMAHTNTSFWTNNSSEVDIYFPSKTAVSTITQKAVTVKIDTVGYQCNINRSFGGSDGDRRIKDSHWHCIGVPSYADLSHAINNGAPNDASWSNKELLYLYEWNPATNGHSIKAADDYDFQAMYAYLVQYAGQTLSWAAAATGPSSIVAKRMKTEELRDRQFDLQLLQGDNEADHTYIRLSDDEEVTAGFEFNHDVSKMMLNGANIYTLIGKEQAAANSLPLNMEQTTVVPVGVKIAADGEYTFAIPEGTEGIGVTLIDSETGIRTSLSALDYTLNLSAGTYDERFFLEISPIKQTPTSVEEVSSDGLQVTGARKVMIDGLLYIVKDGKMFDAQGRQVK